MGTNTLNCFWRVVQPKINFKNIKKILHKNDKFNDANSFQIYKEILPTNINKQYIVFTYDIVPTKMIYKSELYKITWVHDSLIIKNVCICLKNNYVTEVYINGKHPNVDPITKILCLPSYKYTIKFDYNYFQSLLNILNTFYLDRAYIIPHKEIVSYKKSKTLGFLRKINNEVKFISVTND